jgi:hypothetical protein
LLGEAFGVDITEGRQADAVHFIEDTRVLATLSSKTDDRGADVVVGSEDARGSEQGCVSDGGAAKKAAA